MSPMAIKPIVVEKNKDGKVELSIEELQKMLDEAYQMGMLSQKEEYIPIVVPSYPYNPFAYGTEVTCMGV